MKSKGFTLLEILIIVGVIIILATVLYFKMGPSVSGTKSKMADSALDLINFQLQKYKEDVGHYPFDQLEFEAFLKNKKYFTETPVNPFYGKPPEKGWVYYLDENGVPHVLPKGR